MKIEIKIKTTGEIKELNELRVIDIYGFEEKRYCRRYTGYSE